MGTITVKGKNFEVNEDGFLTNQLYPAGPAKQAWKIAGLPKSTGSL